MRPVPAHAKPTSHFCASVVLHCHSCTSPPDAMFNPPGDPPGSRSRETDQPLLRIGRVALPQLHGQPRARPVSRNPTLDISVTRSGSPLLRFHWSLLIAAHWFCRRRAPLKAPSKASKHRWLASLANCHRLVPPNPCGNQRCTALPVHGTCTIGANSSSDPPSGGGEARGEGGEEERGA